MDIKKYIKKQTKKYKHGYDNVQQRREAWKNLYARTMKIFKDIETESNNQNFSEKIYIIDSSKNPIEKTQNQNYMGLQMGLHPIGISKQVNDPITREYSDSTVIERGGQLVFSQSPKGKVVIFLHPSKSDVVKIQDEYLIYKIFKHPNDVTIRKIYKSIKLFFWYSYISSCFGDFACFDRAKIWLLKKKYKNIGKYFASFIKNVIGIISTIKPV